MTELTGTPARRSTRPEADKAVLEPKIGFQHQQYLEYRDGQPYLPLKWRLAWLRADHPQARISTKLTGHEDGVALFKAEVVLPDGASATGWGAKAQAGSEGDGQLDYITLAENQALSRALAALGYGTEYALDFDPPAEHQAIPLPDRADYDQDEDEDERGIEVPMPLSALDTDSPDDETDEDETEEDDETDEDSEEEEIRPTPLRPLAGPRGEVRAIFEKRPALETTTPPAEPHSLPVVASRPVPVPRPAPVQHQPEAASVATPAAASNGVGNAVVEERIRNVRDEALRVKLKQIYYEARQRHNSTEDKVDERSRFYYKKPAFELDSNEADEFYERIVTPSNFRKR